MRRVFVFSPIHLKAAPDPEAMADLRYIGRSPEPRPGRLWAGVLETDLSLSQAAALLARVAEDGEVAALLDEDTLEARAFRLEGGIATPARLAVVERGRVSLVLG